MSRSGIVKGLSGPLNIVLFISLTITIYETLRDGGQIPAEWISLSVNNPAAFNFSSFALSLLLVRNSMVLLLLSCTDEPRICRSCPRGGMPHVFTCLVCVHVLFCAAIELTASERLVATLL